MGVRWGGWGEYLGFGVEYDSAVHFSSNSGEVDADFSPLSFFPMVRYPVFRTDSSPGQQLSLYGGFILASVIDGNIRVSYPELPQSMSGGASGEGTGQLIGISWRYSRIALFSELRRVKVKLEKEGDFWDENTGSGKVEFKMDQTIFGLSYHY